MFPNGTCMDLELPLTRCKTHSTVEPPEEKLTHSMAKSPEETHLMVDPSEETTMIEPPEEVAPWSVIEYPEKIEDKIHGGEEKIPRVNDRAPR